MVSLMFMYMIRVIMNDKVKPCSIILIVYDSVSELARDQSKAAEISDSQSEDGMQWTCVIVCMCHSCFTH